MALCADATWPHQAPMLGLPMGPSRYSLHWGGFRDVVWMGTTRERLSGTVSQADDETGLMGRVAEGDAVAYRELSDRHLAKIVAYANRLLHDPSEAEDVAQETFLRLWQRAQHWRPEAKLHTWLFRVAHNQCIDRLRRRREAGPEALDRQSSGDRPSELLARKRLANEVDAALAALPERQRAAIALTHYQGLNNTEAAAVLDCGVEAVESLLSRGRRTLRKELLPLKRRLDQESP